MSFFRNHIWNSVSGKVFFFLALAALLIASFYLISAPPGDPLVNSGQAIFDQQCQSCHTISGGDLVGPDLQGLFERRDREWVLRFVSAPDRLLAEQDPIAIEMLGLFNGVAMPNPGLSDPEIEAVLAYVEFAGSAVVEASALPEGDANRGGDLFTGSSAFQNGGIACIGCHTVGYDSLTFGGNLGPDLTKVHSRYGNDGLASALKNISFVTMRNVYLGKELSDQEAADLIAYFLAADQKGQEPSQIQGSIWFWVVGISGILLLFAGMAMFWPRQRKTINQILREKKASSSRRSS